MTHPLSAPAPIRHLLPGQPGRIALPVHQSVAAACAAHRDADPLPILFPEVISARATGFTQAFPGRVLYAVKCNPEPAVLRLLYDGGVNDFDVASIGELRLVREILPAARLHFMHPVKAPDAISEAWRMGVRTFVVDRPEELEKVFRQVESTDLLVLVRLALDARNAKYALGGKFGATPEDAVKLLQSAARRTPRLGICFHVGSQCQDPSDYAHAIALAAKVTAQAGVQLKVLDVGGGFPSRYPGMTPPPDEAFFSAIRQAVEVEGLSGVRLWSEPGRTLVADGGAVLARVEARRGDDLYLNDGVFGSLHDAGRPGWRFPVQTLRPSSAEWTPFRVFGPSCDSADVFSRPVHLPGDVNEGDWLEFGQLGAYGTALTTRFNGFAPSRPVMVLEPPLIDRPPVGAPWSQE